MKHMEQTHDMLLEEAKWSVIDKIAGREGRRREMDIHVGDVVKLKKNHPCGSNEWEVLRVGADFRIKCLGCGHQVMIARPLLEKSIREIR